MNYTTAIEINKPAEKVIQLFDDQENYYKWMNGLKKYRVFEGTFGQERARAELEFQLGKRKLKMTEEVISRNFPAEYTVRYEADGVKNLVINRFEPVSESRTRYLTENEFELGGVMRLMGWLMPGSFKKQSIKYQTDFKHFVETPYT